MGEGEQRMGEEWAVCAYLRGIQPRRRRARAASSKHACDAPYSPNTRGFGCLMGVGPVERRCQKIKVYLRLHPRAVTEKNQVLKLWRASV